MIPNIFSEKKKHGLDKGYINLCFQLISEKKSYIPWNTTGWV